jgi:hypothetical protein
MDRAVYFLRILCREDMPVTLPKSKHQLRVESAMEWVTDLPP